MCCGYANTKAFYSVWTTAAFQVQMLCNREEKQHVRTGQCLFVYVLAVTHRGSVCHVCGTSRQNNA